MNSRPAFAPEEWVGLLGADPRPWLWEAGDPPTRWQVMECLSDPSVESSLVKTLHNDILSSAAVQSLLASLPDWETTPVRGHNRPDFAPNLLALLSDMGLAAGDDPRIEHLLDQMLAHQDDSGRFTSFAISFGGTVPAWGAMLCDAHAILESLVRFGRAQDPRVVRALQRMATDLTLTNQGHGWPCIPHSASGWRGPGRRGDICPQVTLQALRTFALLPAAQWPEQLPRAAETVLHTWRDRANTKPYLFGHGRQFKTVKWPPVWYDVAAVLSALSRYQFLRSQPEDKSLVELLACLVAYNFSADGTVTPRSCYQGYEGFSFGQKKRPSPWATAYLCAILRSYNDLTREVSAVDVHQLTSSKGGSGIALPPKYKAQ